MKEKSVRGEDVEVSGDRRRSAARILIGIQILVVLAWVILFAGWGFGSIEEFDPFAIGFVMMMMSISSVVGYLVVARLAHGGMGPRSHRVGMTGPSR